MMLILCLYASSDINLPLIQVDYGVCYLWRHVFGTQKSSKRDVY